MLIRLKKRHKVILQTAFAVFFILIGIYFIKHEGTELSQVKKVIFEADTYFLGVGLLLVVLFVIVQGLMYKYSFRAVYRDIHILSAIILYLKRNCISIFLPAGIVTNMFFFNATIEKKFKIDQPFIYYASTIFSICSIISSILITIPALILLFFRGGLKGGIIWGLITAIAILSFLCYAILSLKNKSSLYKKLEKKYPKILISIRQLNSIPLKKTEIYKVLGLSCCIELIGIFHLYIAMAALNLPSSFLVAIIGYALVLVILMSSPLLRGIGIIEVSLTYALTFFGYSALSAISVAFLFRFFEFWSVLLLGLLSFFTRKDNILFRLTPAMLLFVLGIVNIYSAITPSIPGRLSLLQSWIPIPAIQASIWFVLFSGIFMLMLAIYLFRGLKPAWKVALLLSGLSLIAHLTKGIDWEEGMVSGIVFMFLIISRDQYLPKRYIPVRRIFWFPALISFLAVIVFGTFGFYFMDLKHFNVDFTLWESLEETITAFFLVNVDLHPLTSFAKSFLFGIHILGLSTMLLSLFLIIKPFMKNQSSMITYEILSAKKLLKVYGNSSIDYFKIYKDKKIWFNKDKSCFVSFKTSIDYAFVLENPVAENVDSLKNAIIEFDSYCEINGLKPVYYRIPQSSLKIYQDLGKLSLPIGKEGIIDLNAFSLEGSGKKAMRNALNKLTNSGYVFREYQPPLRDGLIQQLKEVSDEWLKESNHKELLFSQGSFDENELKSQVIFTVENSEGRIEAFVNLIPSYQKGEANFDLMRKTILAPNGTMDFMFIKMFEHLKNMGYLYCNIGMVPMSGIEKPKNFGESTIKIAYEKLRSFSHYRSLYQFKEKFDPQWTMMYLIYEEALDLLFIPTAFRKIIRK